MKVLRSWYADGKTRFVARLAGIGALAGFASWALVVGLHPFFGISRPSGLALLLAILRGALFAALLAIAIAAYLDRREERLDHLR